MSFDKTFTGQYKKPKQTASWLVVFLIGGILLIFITALIYGILK